MMTNSLLAMKHTWMFVTLRPQSTNLEMRISQKKRKWAFSETQTIGPSSSFKTCVAHLVIKLLVKTNSLSLDEVHKRFGLVLRSTREVIVASSDDEELYTNLLTSVSLIDNRQD